MARHLVTIKTRTRNLSRNKPFPAALSGICYSGKKLTVQKRRVSNLTSSFSHAITFVLLLIILSFGQSLSHSKFLFNEPTVLVKVDVNSISSTVKPNDQHTLDTVTPGVFT